MLNEMTNYRQSLYWNIPSVTQNNNQTKSQTKKIAKRVNILKVKWSSPNFSSIHTIDCYRHFTVNGVILKFPTVL